ncbi:hypothetical protein HF325_001429 [Metschnikowia pulcherrima]|uniref:Probable transporter MCH1 n=1 Tax=Metschnikowia pulcherrima TaxID=27326 RepID=A0A8H7GXA4_9ASCO|nr:hypothetical protein HF325_001429 [Metschnikowia pulcherrima]
MQKTLYNITYRIRHTLAARYDLVHLKRWAFAIALVSCLSLGLIMLFSLFSLALHHSVGLTYTQINLIVSFSAVGMYLCLPVLGYLADCYGPALLSLISIWAFCPAYFANAVVVRALGDTEVLSSGRVAALAASFCLIGLATSSLYFSSLLTCAKIYPDKKGLAISLPVSCYGVLSLLGAQILKLRYFQLSDGILDLYKVFMFFSVLYLFVGALNLVLNLIVTLEQDVVFGENEPLLAELERDPEPSLTPQRSAVEPAHHRERYVKFLKDKSAWILLATLFFLVGPLESFQNNLGLIIEATAGTRTHLSDQVWFLLALMCVGIVAQIAPLFSLNFTAISVLNGVCYGGLFTAFPTVVASIWGVDLMGSTWGSFMVAPAFGSITFSLLHGYRMDVCAADAGALGCLDQYFRLTAACFCIALALVAFAWRGIWWRRGMRCF